MHVTVWQQQLPEVCIQKADLWLNQRAISKSVKQLVPHQRISQPVTSRKTKFFIAVPKGKPAVRGREAKQYNCLNKGIMFRCCVLVCTHKKTKTEIVVWRMGEKKGLSSNPDHFLTSTHLANRWVKRASMLEWQFWKVKGLMKHIGPSNLPYSSLELKGDLQSSRVTEKERNTPLSHFLLPFLSIYSCHSPAHTSLTLLCVQSVLSSLSIWSPSLPSISLSPLAPALLFHLIPFSFPPSVEREEQR